MVVTADASAREGNPVFRPDHSTAVPPEPADAPPARRTGLGPVTVQQGTSGHREGAAWAIAGAAAVVSLALAVFTVQNTADVEVLVVGVYTVVPLAVIVLTAAAAGAVMAVAVGTVRITRHSGRRR